MIKRFTVKNFRSIEDATIDFTYNAKKAPRGYQESDKLHFLSVDKDKENRLIPCLALYGSNASGKTNFIRALDTLKNIACRGLFIWEPNKLISNPDIFFEIEFFVYDEKDKNFKEMKYQIIYNKENICSEALSIKTNNNYETIYSIKKSKDSFNYSFDTITTGLYTKDIIKEIFNSRCFSTENKWKRSFLSRFAPEYIINQDITSSYNFFDKTLMVFSKNELSLSLGIDFLTNYQEDNLDNVFSDILHILHKLDFDIIDIKRKRSCYDKNDIDKLHSIEQLKDVYDITEKEDKVFLDKFITYHKNRDGERIPFSFKEESQGTQTVAPLIALFLYAFRENKVLVIDELDRSLHSLLYSTLVSMFKDKAYNKGMSQLVFTAHNLDLLDTDILSSYEVGIVNKLPKKGTILKRISEFEDVNKTDSIGKQYRNGLFRGIPYLYI